MSRRHTILNVPDVFDEKGKPSKFFEAHAEDVDCPTEVAMALHRSGRIDYATAQNFNLQNLFDLLTD